MPEYKWLSLSSGNESKTKPVFALISPANGFYGADGQQFIRNRLELLTKLGFEIKIPVFNTEINNISSIPDKINFDIAKQKAALELMQLVIEPNVDGRSEPQYPASGPNANSPIVGADIIKDCIKNGWNMMPLMGGASFDKKLPHLIKYFAEHPEEKNPVVKIFGYSNITFANSLALNGICSYCPTPFTNFFSKIEEIKAKQAQRALDKSETGWFSYILDGIFSYLPTSLTNLFSNVEEVGTKQSAKTLSVGETEWLGYLESQAEKLKSALIDPYNITNKERKILFYPPNFAKNLEGTSMHYPLNADVFTGLESDSTVFSPNPNEKWSFAIEWMIQKGDNPANISKAFKMLDKFLLSNAKNPPQFIELGVLGTRFDGMNGIWDLIYDQNGNLEISDTNVDIILFRESTKNGLVEKLNDFVAGYKRCDDEDKELNGMLPDFLANKINNSEKISEVSREEIKEVFKWRNQVCERVINKVIETARKHNLPLVFNSSYGHVANMSPNLAGPCRYEFNELNLNLTKLDDRSLTFLPQKLLGTTQEAQPEPYVEKAQATKYINSKNIDEVRDL